MSQPATIGADAVIPPLTTAAASRLRLAALRHRSRGRLRAGRGVVLGHEIAIAIAPGRSVTLGDGCSLGRGCRIEATGGDVAIGPRTRVGERAAIVALAGITIGADAVLGDWAMLADARPRPADSEAPVRTQPLDVRPVDVRDGARIGAHAAVLAGVTVAAGAVVGSYAVVEEDVAPLSSA